jgi:hypothetical protein
LTTIKPEIRARIRLFSKQEGSPKNFPLCPPQYECPLYYKEQYYDCQLILDAFDRPLELGSSFEAPVKFMWPQAVAPKLRPGDSFCLWDEGIIGEGKITAIINRGFVYENIKSKFSPADLKNYDQLCARFAELSIGKNNITLWNELELPGPLLNTLDEIHELRQQYNVIVKGQPFYYIWVFDPDEEQTLKACQKKKLEKSWG